MPSWFAKNSLMKKAIRARGHISCHEKPNLNDNNNFINHLVVALNLYALVKNEIQ